ncbi:hypothetical protein D3C74_224130 [compost metagenome]
MLGKANENKIEILNSMEIVEYDADGATLYYALVKDIAENRQKLLDIGAPWDEIVDSTSDDNEHIDICGLAFKYGGAKWFDGERGWLKEAQSHEQ